MTTFFNRNYHVHHKNLQNSSPQTPKGLLVDVTMDGGVLPSLEASSPGPDDAASSPEINLNDSEDEPDSLVTEFLVTPCEPVTPLPSSPRTPLADIGLRGEMTVLPRKKVYTRDVLAARAALAETESFPKLHSPSDMTPAPQDVPLASAVGDVNSSGVSSANCTLGNVFTSSNSQTAGNCETTVPVCTYSEESVERVVSLPSDLSTSTSSNLSNSFLGSSTATLLVNTHIPLSITPPSPPAVDESGTNDVTCPIPTLTASLETQAQTHLRPHKTTSSLDPRPVSVDLQSSFIQCTETSFDLLNDTVSFFGAGGRGEGVMDEDEDSFDINIQRRDRDSVEINKEAHSVEEMVSRLGKIELGSRRGGKPSVFLFR
jgi:hypothetical protein